MLPKERIKLILLQKKLRSYEKEKIQLEIEIELLKLVKKENEDDNIYYK